MDNENSKPRQNRWAKKRKARNRSKEKTYQNTVRKRLFEMFEDGILIRFFFGPIACLTLLGPAILSRFAIFVIHSDPF